MIYFIALFIIFLLVIVPWLIWVIRQNKQQYTKYALSENQPIPKCRGIYLRGNQYYLVFKDYAGAWQVGECNANGVIVGRVNAL